MFAPVVFSEKENEMDSSRIQYDRWLSQPSLDTSLRAELSAMADDAHAIDNAFGCELTFGTGGLRGILGAGTNRMNVHVVRRAAQAAADYLSGTALPKRAAIGYDSRIGSARFARETAAVFAANGIEAYIYPRLEPVPALSFAVRALSCGVGVCITASHNPAQYNGFKVYGSDGCQLTPAGVVQIAGNLKIVPILMVSRSETLPRFLPPAAPLSSSAPPAPSRSSSSTSARRLPPGQMQTRSCMRWKTPAGRCCNSELFLKTVRPALTVLSASTKV